MSGCNPTLPGSESVFRRQLLAALSAAELHAVKEAGVCRTWDVPYLLRCDIAIPFSRNMMCNTVIECKIKADPQTLSLALGQALIYRRAFLAAHAVLCFPEALPLPGLFRETCAEYNVHIATEVNLVAIVRDLLK